MYVNVIIIFLFLEILKKVFFFFFVFFHFFLVPLSSSTWFTSTCNSHFFVVIGWGSSKLQVVDWSNLVDFLPRKSNLHTECWWDKHSVWRVTSRISNIDQNRPKSTNQPRVTRYKLHQCQPKFASDHNSWCTDCSTTQKQNRWSLSDCTSKTVKKELEKKPKIFDGNEDRSINFSLFV